MKSINSKRILSALLAAAALLTMAACGKKDKNGEGGGPGLIEEYPFGNESVSGLMSDEPTAAVSASTVITYRYTGLSSPSSTVNGYVSLMTSEENGFSIVDSDFVMSEEPLYDESGRVLLARNAATEPEPEPTPTPTPEAVAEDEDAAGDGDGEGSEDGDAAAAGDVDETEPETSPESEAGDGEPAVPVNRLLLLDISWDENSCEIVTREAEGVISPPPEPMTMHEAQKYLESLPPEKLGLEGESMDRYDVFSFDGTILVDNRACVRMNVYSIDNVEQSNEFMGCYLMSLDGRHLYRLNTSTNEITELD